MCYVVISILSLLSVVRSHSIDVRGVSPELIDRYKPDSDGFFHCLNDSSIRIPFNRVNDDYCDCPDGSDEPGTSACANGRFYCRNLGFKGSYIPSSWVDDGICDYDLCCDGSDEKPGRCENKCKQYKEKYEQERKRNNAMVEKGLRVKQKILEASKKKHVLLNEQVSMLTKEHSEVEKKLQKLQKQREKLNTENRKAVDEAFIEYEESVKNVSEKAVTQAKKVNELERRLFNLEQALATMAKEYNHNFNDPAVKRAAKAYQDYAANHDVLKEEDTKKQETVEDDFQNLQKLFTESKVSIADLQKQFTHYSASKRVGWKEWLDSTAENMVNSFLGIEDRESAAETDNLDAETIEKEVEASEKRLSELGNTLQQQKVDLEKIYGPEDILRSRDDCIEKKLGDYVYRLCFTGELVQQDGSSHSVRIGSYESAEYDDGEGKLVIKYGGGEKCWNGPNRSAKVKASCGEKDEILLVKEPEKCSYILEVMSPMACREDQKY